MRETLSRYVVRWNSHDPDGCAACFAAEGVREWRARPPLHLSGSRHPRAAGRPAISRAIAGFMTALPDLELIALGVGATQDGTAWLEWRMRGTHLADWGPWDARGEAVDFVGASIFWDDGHGQILREHAYWDTLLMATPGFGAWPALPPDDEGPAPRLAVRGPEDPPTTGV